MNLLNITPDEAERFITEWIEQLGEPTYRGRQIIDWLWSRPAGGWEETTNLPRKLIEKLETTAPIARLQLDTRQTSSDGTTKFLWRLPDGLAIESVWATPSIAEY